METELIKSIKFYNNYVKGKQFSNEKLENILSDCLFRYIHLWEFRKSKPEEKLINCIKKYHTNKKYKERLDEIKDLLILSDFNETNRLLFIKSVYYEDKYEMCN